MLKKLDRYIVRSYLQTFLYAILLFTSVAVVIDLSEKIDDIIEKGVPFSKIVVDYYLNFIPYIDALLAPLFVFIAVIFFTSRLATRTEFIAMLASGISFRRILYPYMIAASICAAGLFAANNFIVPQANKGRLAFEYAYLNNKLRFFAKNLHMQVRRDQYIYMENYSNNDSTGYKFSYEVLKDGKLIYKLRADRIQWKGKTQKWSLKNYVERRFSREGEQLRTGSYLDTSFLFKPSDFEKRVSLKEEMNSIELKRHIDKLLARGEDQAVFFQIELNRRLSDPAAIIILTLIGVSIASRKVRGGLGIHLVAGFLLSGVYIIFMQFSTTFSTNANLPPFLGVWIPNIIFGGLAFYLIGKAQQ
ncbi:MAG: LptF/LptG family permease [Chitinophagales bacterium]|nr:LptF/LptG family permease [Chitinophagales bacterium]